MNERNNVKTFNQMVCSICVYTIFAQNSIPITPITLLELFEKNKNIPFHSSGGKPTQGLSVDFEVNQD